MGRMLLPPLMRATAAEIDHGGRKQPGSTQPVIDRQPQAASKMTGFAPAMHLAQGRRRAYEKKPAPCPGQREHTVVSVFPHLAPHVERNPPISPYARGGAAALIRLAHEITEPEACHVHVVVLHHGGHILAAHPARHGPENELAVLASAEIVTVRSQFGGKTPGNGEHLTPDHKVAAAGNGSFLRGDGFGLLPLVVAGYRQGIDAVGPLVVHPGGLAAVPVGQDAAAVKPGEGPGACRFLDRPQIARIDPVVVIDEGRQFRVDFQDRSIERMGLAGDRHFEEPQRQPTHGLLPCLVGAQAADGVVGAGIGGHQNLHPHGRP
jgi:hypothetical protein